VTLNDYLEAVAGVLTSLWPGRTVEVDEIPSGADGNFYVGIIESNQDRKLDRRRRRLVQFQVLYFLAKGDTMAWDDWADSMYENFEELTVNDGTASGRIVHLTGQTARHDQGQRYFQFLFNADVLFLKEPEPEPLMENLELSEGIKL
jgi:hypothetical protein